MISLFPKGSNCDARTKVPTHTHTQNNETTPTDGSTDYDTRVCRVSWGRQPYSAGRGVALSFVIDVECRVL